MDTALMESLAQAATTWLVTAGPKVVGIIVVAWIVHRLAHGVVERVIRKAIRPDAFRSREAERKREDTLIRVFHGAFVVILWVTAGMMVFAELGIDVAPMVAAAGVAGLALGFGGQYLIRDVIAGLFIILENQYRVGDVVCLDGTCGLVEDVSLRMTILRDLDGTVHHIPHGAVAKTSNLSKTFSRVNLNLGVSYEADIEHVAKVVNRVGSELAADPAWKDQITKPPQFLRVDSFDDSAVTIKILG
jgi:small-conductance mechanosensitive channel